MAKKIINVVYKVDDKELQATKTHVKGLEDQTKKSEVEMQKLGKSAKQAGSDASKSFLDFKNIIGTISVATLIYQLGSLGKKIFELGVQQEQLNIAFTTFLGSAEKAKKLMAELTKFSIITPFTPDQVNKAAKALLAFGVSAEQIIPTLKMLGDVSSGTGKDLTEMAVIFGQIRSTGRLMGQDLLQLINAGFNPLQVISEKTGRSVRSLKEDMEKGLISFAMVEDAFKTATSAGGLFFNLMEKQSQSIGGKLSTISGNIEEIGKALFKQTSGPLAAFVDFLQGASEDFLKLMKTEEEILAERDQWIIDRFVASKFTADQEIEIIGKKIIAMKDEIAAYGESSSATVDMIAERQHEIDVINQYVKAQKEAQDAAAKKKADIKAEPESPEARKARVKAEEQENETLRKAREGMEALKKALHKNTEDAKTISTKEGEEARKTMHGHTLKEFHTSTNSELAAHKTTEQKKTQITEEEERNREAMRQKAFDTTVGILGSILVASINTHSEESAALEDKYAAELEAAGNNEKAKDSIMKRQAAERKKLEKKQHEDEKARRINTILAETLVNAVKALGLPPIPGANFFAAAEAVAFGALNVALAGKYKDGGWIDGPGSGTSDSVPIMASHGEFMVKASAANESPLLLEAINERKINDRILHNMAANGGSQAVFDDKGIIKAIEENRVDYVNQGYTLMKVERKGSNFKRYIRSKVQGY